MKLRTVAQAIEDAFQTTGTGYRFVGEGDAEQFVSYGEIERTTARYGGAFQSLGLKKGDRLALILPDNRDFVLAFLGAIRAGIVPVPIYPPLGLRKLGAYLEGTLHIVRRCGARLLLTDGDIKRLLGTIQLRAPELRKVLTVDSLREAREELAPEPIDLDDTCFLQFTSGSTSRPKGVVLSHGNLATNIHAFMRGLRVDAEEDHGVSWLPLYHDMGLIGFVLGPLYQRGTVTLVPPLLFLRRPRRWLETLSRHRGTLSFAPSFAYALCCKRIGEAELAGLDLSSWRVAGCGAEPIQAKTLRDFADRFAAAGFDPRAFMACYGMAEATLAVSFTPIETGIVTDAVDGTELRAGRASPSGTDTAFPLHVVNCGRALEGLEVAVFDPEDAGSEKPLADRVVGELRLRGASVTRGYFDDPAATASAFAGDWLRTGDLGYLVDGQVHICGRSKELIIVNGRKYYPQDLEWEASRVEGVRKGNVVAFGTSGSIDDRERVVVCFETSVRDASARGALESEVRASVQRGTGLTVDEVLGLAAGTLPKTSSGKLKRVEARRSYEEGRLRDAHGPDRVHTVMQIVRSQVSYARDVLFGGWRGR